MVKNRQRKLYIKINPRRIKRLARKQLREIVNKCLYDRKKYSFIEYVSLTEKNDEIINKLLFEANLAEDSADSLNELMDYKEPEEIENNNINNQDIQIEDKKTEEKNITKELSECLPDSTYLTTTQDVSIDPGKSDIKENDGDGMQIENKDEMKNNEEKMNEENNEQEQEKINEDETEKNGETNEAYEPLLGKQIVVSGETYVPKEYFKALLIKLGARVTFTVSGKTNLFIHGDRLEDGRRYYEGNKYTLARKAGIPIYSDKKFEEYMQELTNDETWNLKEQIEKLEGKDQIVIKKIQKRLMVGGFGKGVNTQNMAEKLDKKKKLLEKEKEMKKKNKEKHKLKKEKQKEKKEK